jgi:hypothetical protein
MEFFPIGLFFQNAADAGSVMMGKSMVQPEGDETFLKVIGSMIRADAEDKASIGARDKEGVPEAMNLANVLHCLPEPFNARTAESDASTDSSLLLKMLVFAMRQVAARSGQGEIDGTVGATKSAELEESCDNDAAEWADSQTDEGSSRAPVEEVAHLLENLAILVFNASPNVGHRLPMTLGTEASEKIGMPEKDVVITENMGVDEDSPVNCHAAEVPIYQSGIWRAVAAMMVDSGCVTVTGMEDSTGTLIAAQPTKSTQVRGDLRYMVGHVHEEKNQERNSAKRPLEELLIETNRPINPVDKEQGRTGDVRHPSSGPGITVLRGSAEKQLSFTLKSDVGKATGDREALGTEAATVYEDERQNASAQDVGKKQPLHLSTLSPLLVGESAGSSSDRAKDERRQAGSAEYSFAVKDVTVAERPADEPNKVLGYQSSVNEVERFQRIAEQVLGKSRNHDLTVRLDVGNEERVTVGLKDLGQTVTVEVKASNEALINLLQSQKDAITRHLEGKDVRATILIDPNGSGNPEKRGKREARQEQRPGFSERDEGFGTLLEIMA